MRVLAFALPDPVPNEDYEYLLSLLDPPERDRVVRFRLPEDRLRSLVGRLALWWYLLVEGHLSGETRPTFGRKARGKPTLSTPLLSPPLDFNNSHEGPFVLLGVARGITAELGVDVMLPPEDPVELQDSLDLQLTPMEKRHLAIPLPPRERAARLTTLWTIKEGYTKAIGHGVGFGLERIEVELGHMGEVWAVHVDGRPVGVEGWKVLSGMIRQPSEESEEGGSGSVDGSRGSGGSGLGKEGLGEGKVNTQRGEVGWAVIWRGDEWDGEVEMVKWGEFVRVFEERGKKS